MKNKNLWLTVAIAIGVVFLLTWIIPATTYNNSGALVLGSISPVGIWDFFYYLSMQFAWFYPNVIFLIFMAIFYGVINKTGALRSLVELIATKFKKREKLFLMISASIFVLVAGLTGIIFPLFFFVPLFVAVILNLGFNKITALISTVVAILVGFMGTLYATSLYSAITTYVTAGISFAFYKVILLAVGFVAICLYQHFTAKIGKGKAKEEIDEEMLFIEKVEGKKKAKVWPIITAFSIVLVLLVLGLTPWATMYGFKGFADFNTAVLAFKIGSFTVLKSILGSSITAFGTWDILNISALLALVTLVLVFIYKIKWTEVYEGAVSGIKKFIPTIILVLAINMVFILASQSGILTTIIKFFVGMTSGINVFTYSIAAFIGGAMVNESYITSYVVGTMNTVLGNAKSLPLLVLIQQAMAALAMMLVPTSAILLAGLSYFDVSYKNWFKGIWKLFLVLFVVVIIILALAISL